MGPHSGLLRDSIHRRQANLGEQLLEGWVAVKADETLVIAKIQHELVMRLGRRWSGA